MRYIAIVIPLIFFAACKHAEDQGSGLASEENSIAPTNISEVEPPNTADENAQYTKTEFISHCRNLINLPYALCKNILLPVAVKFHLLTAEQCSESCAEQKSVTMRLFCTKGCEKYIEETLQPVETYSLLSEKFLTGACKEKTIPLRGILVDACRRQLETGNFKEEADIAMPPSGTP